jgi:hypothetical protein
MGSSSLLDGKSIACGGNSHLAFCLRQAKQLRFAWERLEPHEENGGFIRDPRGISVRFPVLPRVTTGKGRDGYEGIANDKLHREVPAELSQLCHATLW